MGDSTDPRESIDNLFTYARASTAPTSRTGGRCTASVVLNLGLRYETNRSWQPPSCAPKSDFFAGACYDEVKAPKFGDFAPRSSVVYDMFGDGRTVLKGTANRYNAPLGVDPLGRLNPISAPFDTRQWLPQSRCSDVIGGVPVTGCDRNGDLVPTLNELGTAPGYVFAGVNARYQEDLQRPVVNEYTVEFQRELPQGIVVSAGYVKRQTRQNLAQRNTAVPPSGVDRSDHGDRGRERPDRSGVEPSEQRQREPVLQLARDRHRLQRRRPVGEQALQPAVVDAERRDVRARARGHARRQPQRSEYSSNAYDDNPLSGADRPWSYRVSGNVRAAVAVLRQRHLAAPDRRARDDHRVGDQRHRDAGAGHAGGAGGARRRRAFPQRRAARSQHPQDASRCRAAASG